MASQDHIEVVTNAPGFGSRITSSIKGILFGVVLFIAAFPLLWWGEGRQNLAELVKEAQQVTSDSQPTVAADTLIKTTGKLTTTQTLSDPTYLTSLGGVKVLELTRSVEMYAWKEKKKTKKQGDKNITTYDYIKDWASSPADSNKFYSATGHRNPVMTIKGKSFKVTDAKIGSLNIDAGKATFWESQNLAVGEDNINKTSEKPMQVTAGVIYVPMESYSVLRKVANSPKIGDMRISYSYFPADVDGSVVGGWSNGKIVPYFYDDTDSFLGAYAGSLKAFQAYLQTRHTMISWMIRIGSFLMMWFGLNLILGPILTMMESIPFVGGAGRAIISLVTGVIAFVLWLITFVLAKLWLVLLVLLVLGAGIAIFLKKKKETQVAYEG